MILTLRFCQRRASVIKTGLFLKQLWLFLSFRAISSIVLSAELTVHSFCELNLSNVQIKKKTIKAIKKYFTGYLTTDALRVPNNVLCRKLSLFIFSPLIQDILYYAMEKSDTITSRKLKKPTALRKLPPALGDKYSKLSSDWYIF